MPDPIVTYIQSPEGTDAAAMDAELMPFNEWRDLWGWECDCVLEGQSCPACRGEARKPFGDSIPYEF